MKKFMLKVFGFVVEYTVVLWLYGIPGFIMGLIHGIGRSNPARDMVYDALAIRMSTPVYKFECWRRDLYDVGGKWYAAISWVCDQLADIIDDVAADLELEARRYDSEKIA